LAATISWTAEPATTRSKAVPANDTYIIDNVNDVVDEEGHTDTGTG